MDDEQARGMTREEAFEIVMVEVADLVRRLRTIKAKLGGSDGEAEGDAKKVLTHLQSLMTLLLQTENKLNDLERRAIEGGAEPIDLGAARDEIRRRLDRLRAAGEEE